MISIGNEVSGQQIQKRIQVQNVPRKQEIYIVLGTVVHSEEEVTLYSLREAVDRLNDR